MKILVVTKFVPWPPSSGGQRRSLAMVERLADLGEVTLCGFAGPGEDAAGLADLGIAVRAVPWRRATPLDTVQGIRRAPSIAGARFFSTALAEVVRTAAAEPPDVLVVEHVQMAAYARGLPAGRRILATQNIESSLAASYGLTRRGLGGLPFRLESRLLRRIERAALRSHDTVVVASEADRHRLAQIGPHQDVLVCPNGWDAGEPLPPSDKPVAAFVALMGWRPNVDAAQWLCDAVWPRVVAAVPDAQLLLVGRDPPPSVLRLAGHGIEVTGTVPDVTPYYQRALVALVPLRAGGGSRLKLLEALDAGRPVVATTIGAEGFEDLTGDGVVLADDPEAFATSVIDLLTDAAGAAELGLRGHAAVRRRHSWDAAYEPLLSRVGRARTGISRAA